MRPHRHWGLRTVGRTDAQIAQRCDRLADESFVTLDHVHSDHGKAGLREQPLSRLDRSHAHSARRDASRRHGGHAGAGSEAVGPHCGVQRDEHRGRAIVQA